MNPNIPTLSPVIAGCMRLGIWGANYNTQQYLEFIEGCLDIGVTTFDHADIYGDYTTEADFGKALKEKPALREQLQLITKCSIQRVCPQRPAYQVKAYDSSAEHIIESVNNSLRDLNTEYIDVLLLHRPDYLMHPEEVATAFTQLHGQGKVQWLGVSNFSTSQFDLLNTYVPLVTNQIQVSLFHRNAFDDGTLDQCMTHGIPPMAWSPLHGGSWREDAELMHRLQPVLADVCSEYGITETQALLAFVNTHPAGILAITGTTKVNRVKEAVDASNITFTRQQWYALWQAATGHKIP
ncbi:MAG: aldo/keto reductase [Saprospiraceae bacterium]|nr:aldo/keto reductase [Saprospiraceae bacterium]